MIKVIIGLSVAAVVLSQGTWWQNIFQQGLLPVDTVHGLRVQYDDQHDLIIFFNHTDCFLVDTGVGSEAQWDALIRNQDDLHTFTDTIWRDVQTGTGVTDITQQAAADYHSRLEQWECRSKRIHEVAYTPARP